MRPVECHHWSQGRLANGQFVTGVPVGFIIETEPGIRLSRYGDTAIFGDPRLIGELYRPTVGFLGCAQPGRLLTDEMSPREAALAVECLGLKVAVARHCFNAEQADVREFVAVVREHDTTGGRQALAPRGEEC